jgi:hypothetical protein
MQEVAREGVSVLQRAPLGRESCQKLPAYVMWWRKERWYKSKVGSFCFLRYVSHTNHADHVNLESLAVAYAYKPSLTESFIGIWI